MNRLADIPKDELKRRIRDYQELIKGLPIRDKMRGDCEVTLRELEWELHRRREAELKAEFGS